MPQNNKISIRILIKILIHDFILFSLWKYKLHHYNGKKNNWGVFVHSFDGYKRFWRPCLHYIKKHLQIKQPIFLVTEREQMSENFDNFVSLQTGHGSWAKRLIKGLQMLPKEIEYILYLQEDMWLSNDLSEDTFERIIKMMVEKKLVCVKLGLGSYDPDTFSNQKNLSEFDLRKIDENFQYFGENNWSMSHHTSIFRVDYLLMSLKIAQLFKRDSPFNHESFTCRTLKGKVKAMESDKKIFPIAIFSKSPVIDYIHASRAGELTQEAKSKLLKDELTHLYKENLPGEYFPSRSVSNKKVS